MIKKVIIYSLKFCLILDQLDKIHKGNINVVKTININEILSIPKEKLIFKDSNQLNWTKNWNLGENGSYANHKITEVKKVSNENHNEIILINL